MELVAYPILLLAFVVIFCAEVVAPASGNRCDRRWLVLAGVINLLQMGVSLGVGWVFREKIASHAWWPLPPEVPAPLVGLLSFGVTSFVFYWWHRALHANDFLWRTVHQLHHSPQRLESLSAFYAHPVDSAVATVIGCLSSYVLFGASPAAAAWCVAYTGLFNLYIHSDTRSPRWLGYLVQRPEMHRVHHQRGHHAHNYGIPVWDLLFRTWSNPVERVVDCGFDADKEARVFDMLSGRDVHR
jgi:sterol desaturase/sphingolipid hydroxylase (fatty acid hydroxylase superfamily)